MTGLTPEPSAAQPTLSTDVVNVVAVITKFWPIVAGLAVFGCVVSYVVEFSIYNLDIFYIMNTNDLVFKSTQNLIWFCSVSLYVVATAYVISMAVKLPTIVALPVSIAIAAIAFFVFIFGSDITYVWDRYVLYRLGEFSHGLGLDLVHLGAADRLTIESEINWSQTHYALGVRADAFTWFSIAALAFLAVEVIGLAARVRIFARVPVLLPAIAAPLLTLNASLGIDRAMLMDPQISHLEGDRGYTYATLPGGLQQKCTQPGILLWQGEKSLVLYCPNKRSNYIYLRDYNSIVISGIKRTNQH